jgi:hypothetical protein
MADRFKHPEGKKAQDIELRGKKLSNKPDRDESEAPRKKRKKKLGPWYPWW